MLLRARQEDMLRSLWSLMPQRRAAILLLFQIAEES